jgi:hypothetical protein
MPDITNYAYVWYARDPSQQITQQDLDKIYEIILNYSYPCYLSGSALIRALTPEEKTKLLQHELSFIEEKMETAGLSHIVMMQIPRVLYDLFNLYFTFKHTQKDLSTIPSFIYSCDINIAKMNDYSVVTREYTDSVKDNIFALNAFIVENIQKKDSYNDEKVADRVVEECWSIRDIPREKKKLPSGLGYTGSAIEKSKGFEMISFEMFKQMSLEEAKNIIRQIIHFEKQDSQGRAILYRGSENIVDSLIDLKDYYYSNPPLCDTYMGVKSKDPCISLSFRSLSFNTSIFTGCVMDPGACTMAYFSKTTSRGDLNDKIKLSIKKFLFDDLSVENSLFFIPPIHPYVQLYSTGELFHPRTKIGSDYIELKKKLSDTKPSASSRFTPDFVKGLWGCGPNEATFIQGCDYLKSTETQEQLNALYQRYKSTKVVGTWSSDAATQSKQERFMEARAETVKAAAVKAAAALPRPARPEVDKLLDEWRNFEAIPGETKFEKIKSYYPQLVKRFRFMLSDFMSEYLYSLCPQASVKVSFEERARGYPSNVVYPSATFEFQSKGDFEECQRKLPMLTLTVDKKGLKSTLHSGEKVEKLFRSAGTNLRNAEAIFLYNQQYEEERLNSARSPLDQKSARLARSSPFTELYRKYEQTDNIRNKVEWISFFLDQYSWESKRRDDDTEYKNQLDEYFKFMIDIFHFKFMNIFPTPPFTPPTRPVVPEMPVAPVGPVPEMPLAPVGPVPEKRSGIEKNRQAFVRQAFKETANDDDKFGGGKKRTIRKKNRKGTRTTTRKRQRKNRTRTMRKKSRKFGEHT